MDTVSVVIGVLQLASASAGWRWSRPTGAPPDQRRHFRSSASLKFPLVAGIFWTLFGLWLIGRGLWE